MKDRLRDPDLARLFENTFPSTLDTTVSYFNADENVAFIITGVSHLFPLFAVIQIADRTGYHVGDPSDQSEGLADRVEHNG